MSPHPANRAVLWTFWGALVASVFVYRRTLFRPGDEQYALDEASNALMVTLLFGPVVVALFSRLILVPRTRHNGQLLVAMIVGMAAAESLTFFGIFLFPHHELLFASVSLGLMLLFVPSFLPKFDTSPFRPDVPFKTE